MFVIAGVTGKTGGAAASALIEQNKKVRVLVRNAEQGAAWRAKGAEVFVTGLEDPIQLARGLEGARGAYLLIPPDLGSPALIARNRRITEVFVEALTRAPVEHVVLLSSIGAQHANGTGPVSPLNYAEERLRTVTKLTALRAAYFVDNIANGFHPAREQGVLPALFSPSLAIDMVATPDIGRAAAHALLEPPARHEIIGITGPEKYSYAQAAALVGSKIGKPVQAVHVPREGVVPALTAAGMSADNARNFLELAEAIERGKLAWAGDERIVRGKIAPAEHLASLLR